MEEQLLSCPACGEPVDVSQTEHWLMDLALRDPATGTANYRLLLESSQQLLALARRYGRTAAILCVELGGLTDALARLDEAPRRKLLEQGARRMGRVVRDTDLVAQVSRDTFIVLLSDLWEEEAALRVADRLVAEMTRLFSGDQSPHLSVRVGVALCPHDSDEVEELIRQARSAMDVVPPGGDGIRFFDHELGEETRARVGLASDLRDRGALKQFSLQYQPIYSLPQGSVVGVEALARWNHGTRGLLDAADWVPIAEQTGRIRSLDRWALGEAVRQARDWRDAGWNGWVSVNVSGRSFCDLRFPDRVAADVERHGLEPERLTLEITESAALREPAVTAQVLRELKSLGVLVAVDDFGAGYSSLDYLRGFNPDLVKLDQSFLKGIVVSERQERLLEAMILLSHHLDKPVVAEGVEQERERDWLEAAGCDLLQGYLVGPAMPPSIFSERFIATAG